MKFRSTWVFAILVALVAVYTIYDLRSSQDEVGAEEIDLFELKMEQVEQVSLNGPQGKITIKKISDKKWKLVEPVQDDAEELAVQSLLLTLLGENGRKFSDSGSSNWNEFGLAPPKSTVEISGGGKSETLEISTTNAFDGSFYLRSKDRLVLGDKMWARIVDQTASMLRDHKILPPGQAITSIDVTLDAPEYKGQFTLTKLQDVWKMTPDPGFPIENVKVDHWLDEIQGLRANGFASEHLNSIEEFQLNRPSLTLKIHMGEKTEWDLKFSPDHGDAIQLKTSLKDVVYTIGSGQMRTIRVPPRYFRDGKVPFRFALEKAHEIDFQIKPLKVKIKKADPDWTLVVEGKPSQDKLNKPRLIEFMQKLKSIEAVDFPRAGGGFTSPPQGVRVADSTGKILLEFQVGSEYKAEDGLNKGAMLNYVRVTGQKQILGVRSQELKVLMAPDIVKGKSENH